MFQPYYLAKFADTNYLGDPWKSFSVGSTEPGSPMRLPNATIPGYLSVFFYSRPSACTNLAFSRCDSTHNSSSYFGITYPNRGHMPDRYTPLDVPDIAFYTSLKIFEMALEQWLPCFDSL